MRNTAAKKVSDNRCMNLHRSPHRPLHRASFTLIEVLVALALIAAASVFIISSATAARKRSAFYQECREIEALVHDAANISCIIQNEVDLIFDSTDQLTDQSTNQSPDQSTNQSAQPEAAGKALRLRLVAWDTPKSYLQEALTKPRLFPHIGRVQKSYDSRSSDLTPVVLRFFPRGLDVPDIQHIQLDFLSLDGSNAFAIQLEKIAPPMQAVKTTDSLPDAIESLAL